MLVGVEGDGFLQYVFAFYEAKGKGGSVRERETETISKRGGGKG